MGTPSSLQQGIDCSSSQIYHPQPQIEELAFWQSLQKQQTNKDPPGSYCPQQPVQSHRFIEPQLKVPIAQQLQNEQTGMGPPRSHHFQLPQQHFRFNEPQLQLSKWLQPIMEPPRSHHAHHAPQQQQHPCFTERPLKIGGQLSPGILPRVITPSPLESIKSQWLFHNAPLTINQDKSAGKSVQGASDKLPLVASINTGKNIPRASYKGKEKETSYLESFDSPMNEPLGLGFSGNTGQLNTLFSTNPEQEYKYQSIPTDSDDPVWIAVWEVMQALQACSCPGAAIPDPYGDVDEPMFDFPFFRDPGSFNPSGSVNHSNYDNVASADKMKDRKGKGKAKEVVNRKRKR
ncbi:ATP-dependent helicase BRM-like isoform X2 [Melia azedarach]|nr:ATP-dependent helicase BRM-like isoform X2 [Melia azedarach]